MHRVILSPMGDPSLNDGLVSRLVQQPAQSWLLLLPSARLLHDFRHRLVQRTSLALNLLTFDELVHQATALCCPQTTGLNGHFREELFANLFKDKAPELSIFAKRTSPAMARELLAVITGLGRAGVNPEALVRSVGAPSPLLEDLAILYREYLQFQYKNGLADIEQMYRLALNGLEDGLPWLKEVQEVHIAWFFDFEIMQLAVIEELARAVPQVTIHLPFDHGEQYTLVRRTLRVLEDEGFSVESVQGRNSVLPKDLEHLCRSIFVPGESQVQSQKIKYLAAPRIEQELELVAVEIKKLVGEGIDPWEIALILPDQKRYLPGLRRRFRDWAIDVSMPWMIELPEVPWVRELLTLWEAASGSSSSMANTVKAVYINNFLPLDVDPDASRWLIKSLGEPGEISQWQASLAGQLDWLNSRLENSAADYLVRQQLEARKQLLERGIPGLEGVLAAITKWFGQPLTMEGHCQLMAEIIQANLSRVLPEGISEIKLRDSLAWQKLTQTLAGIKQCLKLTKKNEVISPQEFLERLGSWLTTPVALERMSPRAVQVLAPSECRGLSFKHVFILGLNQNVFPRFQQRHWLWDRPSLRGFADQWGLPSLSDSLVREKIFFHNALTMAKEGLFLSRQLPGINDEAESSVFQLEVEALLDNPETKELTAADILPPPQLALTTDSLRQSSVYRAVWSNESQEPSLARWLPGTDGYHNLYRQWLAEEERTGPTPPGKWDGVLTGNAQALALVAGRFGGKIWSISRLESYIRCPFAFFARYLLKAEPPLIGPDSFNAQERGTWGHWVIEQFWRRENPDLLQTDALEKQLYQLALEWVKISGRDGSQRLWRQRSLDLARRLERLVLNELAWFQRTGFRPRGLEETFGPQSIAGPVYLGNSQIGFRGKIDRVDYRTTEEGILQAAVFDYKTSKGTSIGDITKGLSLQLPVYIAAVKKLSKEPVEAVGGGYWIFKSGKREGGIWITERATDCPGVSAKNSITLAEYEGFEKSLADKIQVLHRQIIAGIYSPAPINKQVCQWCEYQNCCRYDQFRFADKGGVVDDENC